MRRQTRQTRLPARLAAAMLAVLPLSPVFGAQNSEPPAVAPPLPGGPPAGEQPPPPTDSGPVTPRRPYAVKFETLQGATVQGQITRWDPDGFDITVDGSPRRMTWDELIGQEVYRLRKRLVEMLDVPARKPAFLELVAYFASRDDADAFIDRAFDDAKRYKASTEERAEAVKRSEERRQARNEHNARIDRARLASGSPEAAPFSSYAWPAQSAEDRAAAVAALKKQATQILSATGRELTPIDANHVLVYSSLGLADGARRATDIELFIEATLPRLGLPRESVPWFGKLVVIVSEDRDRFNLIEASGFRQEARPEETAIAHYDGASAFVHLLKQSDEVGALPATYRAVALALLHVHTSAARLPAWAHEGFADWLVATYGPTKSLDRQLRANGLPQVRSAVGFGAALRSAYRPREWPFADEATRGAAYIFTSYIAEKHSEAFLAVLKAVKGGEPWETSFARIFKMPVERMAAIAFEYHRMND